MRVILVAILLVGYLFAKDVQNQDTINKINNATVNALLIFTSQEGLNSGLYHFTNTEVDVDMEIYHLPFTYHFKADENINYFLVGNVGYSRTYLAGEVQDLPNSSVLNYLNHIQTYTAGIGGGIRYEFKKDLFISGGVEIIYSRAGASVQKPNGEIGDTIEDFFNSNYEPLANSKIQSS